MEEKKYTRYRFEAALQDANEYGVQHLVDEYVNVLESNKPYQSKCDYIGYSLLAIDEKIGLLDEEMKALKEYKQKLKSAKDLAYEVGAKVFQRYGISKIEGAGISSITSSVGSETTKLELTILDEEALIQQGFYKKVLDEKKVMEAYVQGEYKEFILQHAKVEPVIYIKSPRLRVNRRRSSNNSGYSRIDVPDVA